MFKANVRIGTETVITRASTPLRAGFNLIEVMISLVILSVGLLAVAQMQVAAIRSIAFSRHLTSATYLARQQLEYLRSLPFDDSNPAYKPLGDGGAEIVSKSGVSVFLDNHNGTGPSGTICGNEVWGSTLQNAQNPLNEEGLPTTGGMSFFVAWRVLRGLNQICNGVTAIGPNQMAIEMQVIWWEENIPANPNIDNSSWEQLDSTGAHRVVLTALRQQNL